MSKPDKKTLVILSLGLLVSATAQIIGHFYPELPDTYKGAIVGVGIGIMLVAFMKRGLTRSNR